MAKAKDFDPANRQTAIKNAIKSADFRPKILLGEGDEVREILLGRLMGQARFIVYQPNSKDASVMDEGIGGVFQFVPADAIEGDILRASKLWIPDSAADMVKDILREAEEHTDEDGVVTPARKISVDVAFDVKAIRSSAPLGYTWKFLPLIKAEPNAEADPLVALANRLAKDIPSLTDASNAAPVEKGVEGQPKEPETVEQPAPAGAAKKK